MTFPCTHKDFQSRPMFTLESKQEWKNIPLCMRETDRKKTLEIFVLIHTCKGPGIPTACCFHKTQFARHGLECQMSNCEITKLQTLLPEYFGQVSPICQDFSPISTLALSVYPSSCRLQRGAEHSVGLLYNTEAGTWGRWHWWCWVLSPRA